LLDSLLQERKSVRWLKARTRRREGRRNRGRAADLHLAAEMEEQGVAARHNSKSSGKADG